jgi:hypothetical protein
VFPSDRGYPRRFQLLFRDRVLHGQRSVTLNIGLRPRYISFGYCHPGLGFISDRVRPGGVEGSEWGALVRPDLTVDLRRALRTDLGVRAGAFCWPGAIPAGTGCYAAILRLGLGSLGGERSWSVMAIAGTV